MDVVESWPVTFDPIQVVLGVSAIVALIAGAFLGRRTDRLEASRPLVLVGIGLVAAAVLYSLVLTWTMPFPRR